MYRNSVPDRIQQSPHTFPDVRERASRRKPDVFWSGERRGVSPTCLRTVGNSRYAEDLVDDPNCSKTRRAYASTLASRMTRLLGVPNQTHHTLHFTSKQAQQTNTNEPRRLDTPLFLKHMRRLPQSGGTCRMSSTSTARVSPFNRFKQSHNPCLVGPVPHPASRTPHLPVHPANRPLQDSNAPTHACPPKSGVRATPHRDFDQREHRHGQKDHEVSTAMLRVGWYGHRTLDLTAHK